MSKSVVVVGGGIIGASTAYYLVKSGHDVTIIDQSDLTSGASHVNAGYIAPSHITPLAAPGVILQGLKWMLNPASPLYMKPRWDPQFFRWSWLFHRSSTAAKVEKAIPVIRDINLLSRQLYHDMLTGGELGDFQLEPKGLLMLYQTQKVADHEMALADKARSVGLDVRTYDANEVRAAEPGVEIRAIGGVHYLCDWHTTPTELMPSLIRFLNDKGVRIKTNEKVVDIQVADKKITEIRTDRDVYRADEYVMAAGCWSGDLAKRLDVDLPLAAGKGYSINVNRETGVSVPTIFVESRVAVTPMRGFTRFAGTMEFSGINHMIRPERVRAIAGAVPRFYPSLKINEDEIASAKCGLRPVSPDGVPYIGKSSRCTNVTFATGHAMMGWALGPATGKLVAEVIDGERTSMPIEPFSPDRRFDRAAATAKRA